MKTLIFTLILSTATFSHAQFNSTLNFSYDNIDGEFSSLLSLDIYTPIVGDKFPVIFFVHGGGWAAGDKGNRAHVNKRDFFIENGFIFISVNYRLAPEVSFPMYPQDVAKALAFTFNWVGKFKGDSNKVFVMGHSAGAHLAALVATDDSYLNAYNYSPTNIKGVILLDGAGYDIPAVVDFQTQNNNTTAVDMYKFAFGEDNNLWNNASPINHISETTPPHILFYVDTRQVSFLASTAYYDALRFFNNSKIIAATNTTHAEINYDFGSSNNIISHLALDFILNL